MLQRETGLETLIFDGSMTAHAFLDGVRFGDAVDDSHSLRGSNPVFGGWQPGDFELQSSVPWRVCTPGGCSRCSANCNVASTTGSRHPAPSTTRWCAPR